MGLDGRVVIVTGAGRGLGREHALLLASLGARVVANDRGASVAGLGSDPAPAERVVEEIRSRGGSALASTHDVADWADARRLVSCAVETYGRLDGLVNNAGILRDRRIWEMEESEFDDVVRTDLKGHVAPTRWASDYWRDRAIADGPQDAAVVHTSSHSGLLGVAGQSNYGAAKAGVAAFGLIVADELSEFGVRSNVIVPGARTHEYVRKSNNGIRAKVGIDATVPFEERERFARAPFKTFEVDASSFTQDGGGIGWLK